MWKCRYCKNEFNFFRTTEKGNHAKYCEKNPNKTKSSKKIKESIVARHNEKFGIIDKFKVKCERCENNFIVLERTKLHPQKKRYFCSRSCANSIGGQEKSKKYHHDEIASYTTVAWRYHDKKCLVCNEKNIVAVHHLNENHSDNRPKNLIPLCPTHHQYMHSRHKHLIENKVYEYLKNKWG